MSSLAGHRWIRRSTRCFTTSKPITPRSIASWTPAGRDILDREHFHQPQHLRELTLAHARLEQARRSCARATPGNAAGQTRSLPVRKSARAGAIAWRAATIVQTLLGRDHNLEWGIWSNRRSHRNIIHTRPQGGQSNAHICLVRILRFELRFSSIEHTHS